VVSQKARPNRARTPAKSRISAMTSAHSPPSVTRFRGWTVSMVAE